MRVFIFSEIFRASSASSAIIVVISASAGVGLEYISHSSLKWSFAGRKRL